MPVIDQLLAQHPNMRLPSPPQIAVRILSEVNKTEPSFSELSRIIKTDAALTSRVLRVANSPMLAPMTPIDSLDKALTRLGLTIVTNIALSFVLIDSFHLKKTGDFDFDYFWKRAITAAVCADVTSSATRNHNDNIFIAALLQDIAILVVYTYIPSCQDKFNTIRATRRGIKTIVKECTNYSHSQLGAEILSRWGLPDSITQPVHFHHDPDSAPKGYITAARTINTANKLSAMLNGTDKVEKLQQVQYELKSRYHLTKGQITEIIDQAAKSCVEVMSLLNLSSEQLQKNSMQLLQDANETLSAISIRTAMAAEQYRLEKEQAQQASTALSNSNAELSRLAFQDSLTGLYNVRYFYDYLDRELQRASRYENDFVFMIFDIDDFKAINDIYGHQAGDKVLQEIARTTLNTVRNTDLVARYGGEEFVVVLPETALETGGEIAQRLRRNIAELKTSWKGHQLSVTASIGVSCYQSRSRNMSKEQLIATADERLYHSKSSGKNRVTMPEQKS